MLRSKISYQGIKMSNLLKLFAGGVLFAASINLEPETKKIDPTECFRPRKVVRRRDPTDEPLDASRRQRHHQICTRVLMCEPDDDIDYVAATGLSRDVASSTQTKQIFKLALHRFDPRTHGANLKRATREFEYERKYLSAQISDEHALTEARLTNRPVDVDQRLEAAGLFPEIEDVRHTVLPAKQYRNGVYVDLGVEDVAKLSGAMAMLIGAGGDLHRIEVKYRLKDLQGCVYRMMIGTVFFRPGWYCARHFIGQSHLNAGLRELLAVPAHQMLYASISVHHPTNGAKLDAPGAITVNNVSYGRPTQLRQWTVAEFSTMPVKGYAEFVGAGSTAMAKMEADG